MERKMKDATRIQRDMLNDIIRNLKGADLLLQIDDITAHEQAARMILVEIQELQLLWEQMP